MSDIWEAAAAAESAGITADAIRELWSATWAALDNAADVLAIATEPAPSARREAAREALTASYIGVVKSILRKHVRDAADREDMRQTALAGLWQGFREFDPAKHRSPAATVQRNVMRALSDAHALRFGMAIPESLRLAFSAAFAEAATFAAGTEPVSAGVRGKTGAYIGTGVDELAAELAPNHGLSTEEFWRVYRVRFLAEVQPDGSVVHNGDDAFLNAPDRAFTATYRIQESVSPLWESETPADAPRARVAELLAQLPDREREVIELRYGLNGRPAHTEDEAAAALGLTNRRVRQIAAAALTRLRACK